MGADEGQSNAPLILFYAYVDKDEVLCREPEKHLSLLQRQGLIAGWHYQKVSQLSDNREF